MRVLCSQVEKHVIWQDLHTKIDLLDAKILEKLYLPDTEPLLLCILCQRLNNLNFSKETIRKRIYQLRELGLLRILDKTNPLVLWPIEEMKGNIRTIVTLFYARLGLKQYRDFYE